MKTITLLLLILLASLNLAAQKTWTSVQSGNWNNASTWQTSGGASGAPNTTVQSTDVIIITNGHTVTVTNNILLENNSSLYITNGGKLKMGNSGNPAPTFTMKSSGNKFYMQDGFYESHTPGSGGNMLIENGLIDWRGSVVYVSGNYTFKSNVNNITMINMCIRVAQNILFEGIGNSSNYAVMTDVFHVSGLSGTGNLTIKDNSFIQATNIRLNASANTSNLEFFISTITGSIYSINAGQKITVQNMTGNANLSFWCAPTLDPNLAHFSGSKVNNCTIAQEVCTGVASVTDVGVTKTASDNPVTAGTSLTYTIVVTNLGQSAANNVVVTDVLPAAFTVNSTIPSVGNWNAPNWSVGNMTAGSSATLQITGTVNVSFTGSLSNTASVTTTSNDNNPNNNQSTVIVTVIAPPTGPTANDDFATTPINTPIDINVLENDVAGSTALNPTAVSLVSGTAPNPATVGTFTVNPVTGIVTFTPVNGYTGTATIDYQVCDLNNLCDIATITVVISPALVGPTANDDFATTLINTAVDINVLTNDLAGSVALDPTSVSFVPGTAPNPATVGTFTVNPVTGLVTFTPVNGYSGTATIEYQVCDLNNLCDIALITVTIIEPIGNCSITKANGGGFQTTLVSVVDDCSKITVTLLVERTGPGQDLSHYAIQAQPGTYSNVSVQLVSGTTMNYTVDLGPNLGATQSFQGFKVDNISGLSIGEAFTITYQLSTLQDQQTAAKAGQNNFIAEFTVNNFNDVMFCAGTTCNGGSIDNLFPANGFGTLAFEDLWPGKGDYDFNDMVIDYQFEITSNVANFVQAVKATFVLKAFGAAFENGFGFQLSGAINASDLNVTGLALTDNIISINSNGTESGQSKPTIIVFDNAYAHMPHPGMGIGVNTTPGAPYVQPVTFTVNIDFKPNTYTLNDLNISAFNPFIIVNKVRSHEVHLPNYPPTDLADMSLFGQWEDASNPAAGKYYVTVNNLPWAINIYESFDYPIEKQEILWAHLKFAEWAMSGGLQFPDWYKNLTGYRNSSLIYQVPQN